MINNFVVYQPKKNNITFATKVAKPSNKGKIFLQFDNIKNTIFVFLFV
jgi:hypothetical protein